MPGIAALIMGLIALSQIKKEPDKFGGKPFATAGVIIGSVSILFYLMLLLWFLLAWSLGDFKQWFRIIYDETLFHLQTGPIPDPNLSFCIDDGTPLTTVDADDDATVVTPRGNENDWNARAYQPPQAYVPPGTPVKRRRAWPWVVGILGAFILGIVVIAIAGAFLAPKSTQARTGG